MLANKEAPMPRESGFTSLRVVALLVCCVGSLAAQSLRRVFVLAGQSNISNLLNLNSLGAGSAPSNVHFWVSGFTGEIAPSTSFPTAVVTLGARLGAAFPQDRVDVAMIAVSGSALLKRNNTNNSGYWVDPNNWLDTS